MSSLVYTLKESFPHAKIHLSSLTPRHKVPQVSQRLQILLSDHLYYYSPPSWIFPRPPGISLKRSSEENSARDRKDAWFHWYSLKPPIVDIFYGEYRRWGPPCCMEAHNGHFNYNGKGHFCYCIPHRKMETFGALSQTALIRQSPALSHVLQSPKRTH